MPKVWVDKLEWETVKARTRNINIRMAANIKTPGVQAYGSGMSAGITIDLPLTDTAGDTYKGMFKPINTSTKDAQKIKIVDGQDITKTNAGRIQVNEFMVTIPVEELIIIKASVIYFEAALIMNTATPPVATGATVEIKQSDTLPDYTADKAVQLISRIIWENDKIKDFSREPISQQMIIFEPCPEPEAV